MSIRGLAKSVADKLRAWFRREIVDDDPYVTDLYEDLFDHRVPRRRIGDHGGKKKGDARDK